MKDYYKGSDILIRFRFGTEANPIPPNSLIDYEFELIGMDDSNRQFSGITFKKAAEGVEYPVVVLDNDAGLASFTVPKEFTANAREGVYMIVPTLTLDVSLDEAHSGNEFVDKSDAKELFKLVSYD
jgi:hypothetical protein